MLALDICNNDFYMKLMLIFNILIKVLFIVTPLIVIVVSSFSFLKVIGSGDSKSFKEESAALFKRILAAIIVIILPNLVFPIVNLFVDTDNEVVACIKNVTIERVKKLEALNKEENPLDSDLFVEENNLDTNEVDKNQFNNNSSNNSNNNTNYQVGNFVAIDNKHFNNATLNSKLSGNLVWNSSNENVATVNNGVVTAVKGGSGDVTITASNGQSTEEFKVVVIAQRNKSFVKDSEDYSNEIKEAYINNAELLCNSGNIANYPECETKEIPYYTGDESSLSSYRKTLTRHIMSKQIGVSATDYLIFISSKKQTLTLLQKQSGSWRVIKTYKTGTAISFSQGDYYHAGGHHRFDYYIGAVEYSSTSCNHTSIAEFWQGEVGSKKWSYIQGRYEPYQGHRYIHYDSRLGYPSSQGCNHLSCKDYKELYKMMENAYGTRIIVF